MVIKDHGIFSAVTVGHRKAASLIGCNFPCELHYLGKYIAVVNTGSIRISLWVSRRFGGAKYLVILS